MSLRIKDCNQRERERQIKNSIQYVCKENNETTIYVSKNIFAWEIDFIYFFRRST